METTQGAIKQAEIQQDITIESGSTLAVVVKAEIDMQIATAKAYPRSITTFLKKTESVATLNEEVAASCSYALVRKGKAIEGPSIRLAEIASSSYGNLRSGARVIANDGKTVTAQGICHDLETNYCVTVEVKRSILNKDGFTYSEDMQVVTGNAACAIALRNAIFKVIPSALIEPVYQKAKEVARGKAETLPERRGKAIKYLEERGITQKQILGTLGLKKIEDIDLDNLSVLRGMIMAVKNGESSLRDLFDPPKATEEEKKQAALKAQEGYKIVNPV